MCTSFQFLEISISTISVSEIRAGDRVGYPGCCLDFNYRSWAPFLDPRVSWYIYILALMPGTISGSWKVPSQLTDIICDYCFSRHDKDFNRLNAKKCVIWSNRWRLLRIECQNNTLLRSARSWFHFLLLDRRRYKLKVVPGRLRSARQEWGWSCFQVIRKSGEMDQARGFHWRYELY